MTHAADSWRRAERLFAAGRADDAIDAALEAVSVGLPDGDAYRARVLIGRAFATKRQYADARRYLDDAIERWPDRADAYAWRGYCHFEERRDADAQDDFDRALTIDPACARARYQRGVLRQTSGDPAAAVDDYTAVAGDAELGAEAVMCRGACRLMLGDRDGAEADLVDAVARGCDAAALVLTREFAVHDPDILLVAGRHHRAHGHVGQARHALEHALEHGFDRPAREAEAHVELARLHLAAERWQDAATATRRALDADDTNAAAHAARGHALWRLERDDEAEAAYARAVELDAGCTEARTGLAELLLETERFEEAVAELEAAVAADEHDAGAHYLLGRARLAVDRRDDAERALLLAEHLGDHRARDVRHHALGTGSPRDAFAVARAALDAEDYERAAALFHDVAERLRAASRAPGDHASRQTAAALANRGLALARLGRADDAIAALAEAARQRPTVADPWNTLGALYRRGGEYRAALECLDEVVELAPNNPLGYYNRAGVHADLGDGEAALADLDEALGLGLRDETLIVDVYYHRARVCQAMGRLEDAFSDYEQLAHLGWDEAILCMEALDAMMRLRGTEAEPDRFPFLFYGTRPDKWRDVDGYRMFRMRFRRAPAAEERRRIETLAGARWSWSGVYAELALDSAATDTPERVHDALLAVHRAEPVAEVVDLGAQCVSANDAWEEWTLARQLLPSAAAPLAHDAALFVCALHRPGDPR